LYIYPCLIANFSLFQVSGHEWILKQLHQHFVGWQRCSLCWQSDGSEDRRFFFFGGGGAYKGLGLFLPETDRIRCCFLFNFVHRHIAMMQPVTRETECEKEGRREWIYIYIYIYIKKGSFPTEVFFCRILFVHFVITGKIPVESVTLYCGSVLRKRSLLKTLPSLFWGPPPAHVIYLLCANHYWKYCAFWAQSVYIEHVMESPVVIITGCFHTTLPYRTIHYNFSKTRSNLNYIKKNSVCTAQ
jgi:hypothetical protein